MDGLGTTILQHVPENSFPSDHTTFMLAIAWSLFFSVTTRQLGLSLIFIGIVGGSFRVLVGIHYPFDILGSILVGAISAIIVHLQIKNLLFIDKYIFNAEEKILKINK